MVLLKKIQISKSEYFPGHHLNRNIFLDIIVLLEIHKKHSPTATTSPTHLYGIKHRQLSNLHREVEHLQYYHCHSYFDWILQLPFLQILSQEQLQLQHLCPDCLLPFFQCHPRKLAWHLPLSPLSRFYQCFHQWHKEPTAPASFASEVLPQYLSA